MDNQFLDRQRKMFGLLQLALMALFWLWFLFCTPVTPLAGSLRGGASDHPIPAEGLWGGIGFYTRPADNGLTYFLMVLFCGLIVYKIIRNSFFPHRDQKRSQLLQERRRKKSVRYSARLKAGKF